MPKLNNPSPHYTCFMCGKQAHWISINSKQPRCVEKITQCTGFVKKAQSTRDLNTTPEERATHMKKMSVLGNKELDKLHKDPSWRRQKGINVSNAKSTIPAEQREEYELYENLVDRITRDSWIYHQTTINPNKLIRGKDYELDHKFSKHQGFLNKVPPEIIGHHTNLQLIPRHSNRQKYNKCSITIDELYESIK